MSLLPMPAAAVAVILAAVAVTVGPAVGALILATVGPAVGAVVVLGPANSQPLGIPHDSGEHEDRRSHEQSLVPSALMR